MNKKTLTTILMFAMASGAQAASVQTNENEAGQVAASFLQTNPSVRAASLGGDQAALSGQMSDMFSNPASLTSLNIPELWLTHNKSFIDSTYSTLGFGLPRTNHAFGFSGQFIDDGEEERLGVDEGTGDPIELGGQAKFTTTLLHAGWAMKMNDRWSVGLLGKAWQEDLDGKKKSGWAGDLGLLGHSVLRNLDLALTARHLGPAIDGYDLPRSLSAGAAYHMGKLSLYSTVDQAAHRDLGFRGGLEFRHNIIALRAGYESLSSDVDESLANFTMGAGFRIKGWKVDYAWVPKGDLGDQHRIALSFGFGLTPEERAEAAKQVDRAMAARMKEHANQNFANGQDAMKRGDWKLAADEFQQALTWDPSQQGFVEALNVAKSKMRFSEAQAYFVQGKKHAAQDEWLDAAYNWKKTLDLVPSHEDAKKSLKLANARISRSYGKAAEPSSRIDKIFDEGVRYFVDGDYDAALKEWNVVLKVEPNRPALKEYVEKARRMKAESELAALKSTTTNKDKQIDTLAQQAYTFYSLDQIDKAINNWEKILVLDPENKDAKQALREAKNRRELKASDTADRRGRRVDELNASAMTAYSEGRLENAVAIWNRALLVEPNNLWIRKNIQRVESEMASRGMR